MPPETSPVAFGTQENDRPSVWRATIVPPRPIKPSSRPIKRTTPSGPGQRWNITPRAHRPTTNGSQTCHILPRSISLILKSLLQEPLAHGVDEIGVGRLDAGRAH